MNEDDDGDELIARALAPLHNGCFSYFPHETGRFPHLNTSVSLFSMLAEKTRVDESLHRPLITILNVSPFKMNGANFTTYAIGSCCGATRKFLMTQYCMVDLLLESQSASNAPPLLGIITILMNDPIMQNEAHPLLPRHHQ